MKKYILFSIFSFLLLSKVYATPNNSMSISPSAVDNTVIAASDENTRNTEISSKFNAHGHTDIAQTANTLNIGDALSSNKIIVAYNADTNKPFIKYDDTTNEWIVSSDGVSQQFTLSGSYLILSGSSLYVKNTTATAGKIFISQADGGCSSCGVDNAGTVWSCSDVTCP